MEQKPFIARFRICFVETDAGQVVHFSNYFRYFERTEEEFYHKIGLGGYSYLKRERHGLPRISASCKYTSPMRLDEEIEVHLTIEQLREKEIQYKFLIHNLTTNKIAAEGALSAIWLDLKKWETIPIPKDVRKLFTSFMDGTLTLT